MRLSTAYYWLSVQGGTINLIAWYNSFCYAALTAIHTQEQINLYSSSGKSLHRHTRLEDRRSPHHRLSTDCSLVKLITCKGKVQDVCHDRLLWFHDIPSTPADRGDILGR